MSSESHDCCRCSGKMIGGRHDFMTRIGNEIIVVKDVPALICDTCGEVEYELEVSREIDRIRKDLLAGRLRARPLVAGGERINHQQITGIYKMDLKTLNYHDISIR